MTEQLFSSYRDSVMLSDVVDHPRISVGRYSYYAGYYHQHSFMDCVRYLDHADKHKKGDCLTIGQFCSIASGVVFMMGGNTAHRHDWFAAYPLDIVSGSFNKNAPKAMLNKGDTIIGNDVWIGSEAMIMPGITISDGAVIGARALVTKDVAPYTIVGGNPARVLKPRFSDEIIELLLALAWWDWPIDRIKQHCDILQSSDVELLRSLL